MQIAVVFNSSKIERATLEPKLLEAIGGAPADVLWFEGSADDGGRGAVRQAIAAGVDLVIVAGGDGTIRVAVEELAETKLMMAIVPVGTGNLLARNLSIDVSDIATALDTAVHGADRTIDVADLTIEDVAGKLTKQTFAVMIGFGLDAQMIAETDDDLKRRIGWLAYVSAAGRAVAKLESVRVSVSLDSRRPKRSTVSTLIIGNCGTIQNGIVVLPQAEVDDDKLDVALVRPAGFRGWLQLGQYFVRNNVVVAKLLGGGGPQRSGRALGYGQGRTVRVRLHTPRIVQVDGDLVGEAVTLHAKVRPRALHVRVPVAS